MQKGTLLVVSGPSGAGKGTLCNELLARRENAKFSVSATTRAPRPGEIDGVHYFFVTNERFDEMIQNGEFLEYACVFGMNRYGTPRKAVEERLAQGIDVILDIDVQGALNVKKAMPEAVMLFLLPPSFEVLRTRLIGRGTETDEQIQKRLATAKSEIALADQYDYVIINDQLEAALRQVEDVLDAESCRPSRWTQWLQQFREDAEQ